MSVGYGATSGQWTNIVTMTDHVHTGFDTKYVNDGLNRLTEADEGTISVGDITSRTRKETWTLTQPGNWSDNTFDANGDADYLDVGDWNWTSATYNVANEQLVRSVDWGDGDGTPTSETYPGTGTIDYDPAGNLTNDEWHYEYVYDAWNRLVAVTSADPGWAGCEYRYNGLGWRITAVSDTDVDDSLEDEVIEHYVYTAGWQKCAVYHDASGNPYEIVIHHNAGLDGAGGSSYIDAVILRDRDEDLDIDHTLEERRYYCHHGAGGVGVGGRADVAAIVTDTGKMVEWVKYSAYGVPFGLPAGDTDSDGDWDATDSGAIAGGYDVRKDADLNGTVDSTADVLHANSITGTYQTLGRNILSSSAVANRAGYAGYESDPWLTGSTNRQRSFYHVRHRFYDAGLGRWHQRDPMGYVDGVSLYQYARSSPIIGMDPMGLAFVIGVGASRCSGQGTAGAGCQINTIENPIKGSCRSEVSYRKCIVCCCSTFPDPTDPRNPTCRMGCRGRFKPPSAFDCESVNRRPNDPKPEEGDVVEPSNEPTCIVIKQFRILGQTCCLEACHIPDPLNEETIQGGLRIRCPCDDSGVLDGIMVAHIVHEMDYR